MLGLTPEDFESDAVGVWPENWPIYILFCEVSTQWLMGPNGPSGLNHTVALARLERMKLSDDDYEFVYQGFRTMEIAALQAIRSRS